MWNLQKNIRAKGILLAAAAGVCGLTACGNISGECAGGISGGSETAAVSEESDSRDGSIQNGENSGEISGSSAADVKCGVETEMPEEYVIADFPQVLQMPELPTGCEITALTMILNYYGYDVDKVTMAAEYLPTAEDIMYYGNDGLLHGNDLNEYFIGDPFSEDGVVCGTGAIVTAADSYLEDEGSSLEAVDLTGADPEELYELVSEDTPVAVWVTIEMANRDETQGWYTDDGEYVEWSDNDHGAVLIGYSPDTVTIADPISGIVEYDRVQFERVYAARGKHGVILAI